MTKRDVIWWKIIYNFMDKQTVYCEKALIDLPQVCFTAQDMFCVIFTSQLFGKYFHNQKVSKVWEYFSHFHTELYMKNDFHNSESEHINVKWRKYIII